MSQKSGPRAEESHQPDAPTRSNSARRRPLLPLYVPFFPISGGGRSRGSHSPSEILVDIGPKADKCHGPVRCSQLDGRPWPTSCTVLLGQVMLCRCRAATALGRQLHSKRQGRAREGGVSPSPPFCDSSGFFLPLYTLYHFCNTHRTPFRQRQREQQRCIEPRVYAYPPTAIWTNCQRFPASYKAGERFPSCASRGPRAF